LLKVTISLVIATRSFVCPRGKTELALDGFVWNLRFEDFRKSVEKKLSLIKIWQELGGAVHGDAYIFEHTSLNPSFFFASSCYTISPLQDCKYNLCSRTKNPTLRIPLGIRNVSRN